MRMEAAKERTGAVSNVCWMPFFGLIFGWGKHMNRKTIGIKDVVWLDNKLWLCLSDYGYLVSMDMDTKETKSYKIPGEGKRGQKKAFESMALVGRKLYLIPFYERAIVQFDIDSQKFEKIETDYISVSKKMGLFFGVGKCGHYLFAMGANIPVVLRVNTINNKIDYITDWWQKVENLIFDHEDIYFRKQCVVQDDKLFVPFCNANAVLEVDCITMKTKVHKLGEKRQGYSGICLDGNFVWISPRKNGDLVKWNLDTKQIEDMVEIPGLQKVGSKKIYVGIIAQGKKRILFPGVEKQSEDIEENITELKGIFRFVKDDERRSIYYEMSSGTITVIDKELNSQSDIVVDNVNIDVVDLLYENDNVIVENAAMDIRNFIEYVNTNL